MVAYGCLLLAPAEGWWPLATCRALRALLCFKCMGALQALLKVDGLWIVNCKPINFCKRSKLIQLT